MYNKGSVVAVSQKGTATQTRTDSDPLTQWRGDTPGYFDFLMLCKLVNIHPIWVVNKVTQLIACKYT